MMPPHLSMHLLLVPRQLPPEPVQRRQLLGGGRLAQDRGPGRGGGQGRNLDTIRRYVDI